MAPARQNKQQSRVSPKKTRRPKPSPTASADIRVSRQRLTQQSLHHGGTTGQPQVYRSRQRQPTRDYQSLRPIQRLTVGEVACRETHPGQDHSADDEKGLVLEHGYSKNTDDIDDHHQCAAVPVIDNPGHGASRCVCHATHFQPVYSRLNPPQSTIFVDATRGELNAWPIASNEDVTSTRALISQQQNDGDKDQSPVVVQQNPTYVQSVPEGRETFQATSIALLNLPSLMNSVESSTSTSARASSSTNDNISTSLIDSLSHSRSPKDNYLWETDKIQEGSQTIQTNESLQYPQDSFLSFVDQDELPSTSSESCPSSSEAEDDSQSKSLLIRAHVDSESRGHRKSFPYHDNTLSHTRIPIPSTSEATRLYTDEEAPNKVSDEFDRESVGSVEESQPAFRAVILQVLKLGGSSSPGPSQQISGSQEHWKRESPAQLSQLSHLNIESQRKNSKKVVPPRPDKVSENKGPCLRCTMQKLGCQWDPDNSDVCKKCQEFNRTSKKTIHNLPCTRGKLSNIRFHRVGGLEITSEKFKTTIKNTRDCFLAVGVREIGIVQAVFPIPIYLRVVRFKSQPGDETARFWTVTINGKEYRKRYELATWRLEDIHETAKTVEQHTIRHALSAMEKYAQEQNTNKWPCHRCIIHKAYQLAVKYYKNLLNKNTCDRKPEDEAEIVLLGNLIIFWFGLRNSTGSSWLHEMEVLDMEPCCDPDYPLGLNISVPRMIVAQIDSIQCNVVLPKYQKRITDSLTTLMTQGNPRFWFVIFITLFILLREVSWMSKDRYRHARDNYGSANIRYTIPFYVEKLHYGSNILLMYWNYYNCQSWPRSGKEKDRLETYLADLMPEQFGLVHDLCKDPDVRRHQEIWKIYKDNPYSIPDPEKKAGEYSGSQRKLPWDDPLYWVAQLVETDWSPRCTYQSEIVPKKAPLLEENDNERE